LAGDSAAWQQLYQHYHDGLLIAICNLLPSHQQQIDILDEIAARVWYALVRNRAELLGRFDPARGHRLADFLAGIARMVARQFLRSERRRRSHERTGARKLTWRQCISESELAAIFDEFNSALSAGEQSFVNNVLLLPPSARPPDGQPCSGANFWQRRHRLRAKLRRFLPER
jgi:DNA-directed RNA polymerase specialized sigma24 family protein